MIKSRVGKVKELIKSRVEKGAAWLDQQKPGWFYTIDLASLNLGCGQNCVLGQLWAEEARIKGTNTGGYLFVRTELEPDSMENSCWVREHGFQKDGPAGINYQMLDEAWIELIKARVNA